MKTLLETWLILTESNIGEFTHNTIKKDPATVHPVAYDYAWESNNDKIKDEWLKSLHDTAKSFGRNIERIIKHLDESYRSGNSINKGYLKHPISPDNNAKILHFLYTLAVILQQFSFSTQSIKSLYSDVQSSPSHNEVGHFQWFPSYQSFGVSDWQHEELIEQYNETKQKIEEYLSSATSQSINKIMQWVQSIFQKGKESHAEILGHQLRNHTPDRIPEFKDKINTNIKELEDLYNKHITYGDPHNIIQYVLLEPLLIPFSEKFNYRINKILFNDFEKEDIKEIRNFYNSLHAYYPTAREYTNEKELSKYNELLKNITNLLLILEK